jgi:hypothetical protein
MTARDLHLRRAHFHFGAGSGGSSLLVLYPEQNVCVAVAANLGHAKFPYDRLMGIVNPFLHDPARSVIGVFLSGVVLGGIVIIWHGRSRMRRRKLTPESPASRADADPARSVSGSGRLPPSSTRPSCRRRSRSRPDASPVAGRGATSCGRRPRHSGHPRCRARLPARWSGSGRRLARLSPWRQSAHWPDSARAISSLLGSDGSSTLRALSAPTTGRPSGLSRPTWSSSEAWSQ